MHTYSLKESPSSKHSSTFLFQIILVTLIINCDCICIIPLFGIVTNIYLSSFFVNEKTLSQYTSFSVILKLTDDSRNRWPKHVVLNK